MPRLALVSELTRTAEALCPGIAGVDGVYAAINLALKRLPQDGLPEVAELLYGLTDSSKGRRLKERRKLAHKKYLTTAIGKQKRHKIETFRTEDEPEIMESIAGALVDLIQESYTSTDIGQRRVGPDEVYLKTLATRAADLYYACRAALFVQQHDLKLRKEGIRLERGESGFPLTGFLFEKYLAFTYTLYPMPAPYVGLCFADFFLANGYRRQQLDSSLAKQLVDLWRQGADASPTGQAHRTTQEQLRLTVIATDGRDYDDEPLYTEHWYPWINTIGTTVSRKYLESKLEPLIASSGATAYTLKHHLGLDKLSNDIAEKVSETCYEQYGAKPVRFDLIHYFIPESEDLIARVLPDVPPQEITSAL